MSYLFDSTSLDDVTVLQQPRTVRPLDFRIPNETEFILYSSPRSYYSQIVMLCLYYKGVAFTNESMDIHKGEQFNENFLQLSPRAEVPVLRCGRTSRIITDSLQMINHVEELFQDSPEIPKVFPVDPTEKHRCGELVRKFHQLKLEVLTFGTVQYDDLALEPKGMYKSESHREKIREYLKRRRAIYRTELKRFPQHEQSLNAKLKDIEHDWHFLEKREDYERLILTFENVLDECEVELTTIDRHRQRKVVKYLADNPDADDADSEIPHWWLCSKQFTVADICLGILLHRIYEIGFYRRLISSRPHVKEYFDRIRNLEAFRKAVNPSGKDFFWWIVWIPLGTIVTFALWGLILGSPKKKFFKL